MNIEQPGFLKCAKKTSLGIYVLVVMQLTIMDTTGLQKIWIAPTNENKEIFFNTMRCMGYTENEVSDIKNEDFTSYFIC
jgi:hypothetical protein